MAEKRVTTGGKGDLRAVVNVVNDLIAKYELVLAKLDADGGITDTNYAALHGSADTLA